MARSHSFNIVRTPVPVYISSEDQALEWVEYFADLDELGVDTETTGLNIMRDRVRFFSLASADARVCAPVRLLPLVADLLADSSTEKRLTNMKYDKHLLANEGVELRGHLVDTADMDFVVDENREGQHGLKECARDYLGLRMTPFNQVFGNAGSGDDEVAVMCEIHDILEMHDTGEDVERARKLARDMLLQLGRVSGSEELLKAVRRLHLSLRADSCTLTAKQVVGIAEAFDVVQMHAGAHRYVSEFFELLSGTSAIASKDRKALVPYTLDDTLLREATEIVYDKLVAMTGIPADPIAYLREKVGDYASLDAWASFTLVDVLRERLCQPDMAMVTEAVRDGLETPRMLLSHSEEKRVPLLRTLWCMERRGIRVDVEGTKPYAKDMQEIIDDAERAIVKLTGDLQFNPNSPDQLRDKLFSLSVSGEWEDPFGNPPWKWTGGGQSGIKEPSTSKAVLEDLAGKGHELSKLILRHRQFRKLKTDYIDGLPRWADRNQRIHTSLKSTGAVTWRLASADPNLQNIPTREPVWGKRIRGLFVAGLWGDCDPAICVEEVESVPVPDLPPDFPMTLVVADYSQIELCVVAHESGDERMVNAIRSKQDLHCKTVEFASALGSFGLPKGITYEQAKAAKDAADVKGHVMTPLEEQLVQARSNGKSTIFGIIYGIGAVKLGMQLGLPILRRKGKNGVYRDWCPEGEELINSILHEIYPDLGRWIEETHEQCHEELCVYTAIGHPRRLPDIVSSDGGKSSQARRQSVNTKAQGGAADIVNEAMIQCERDPILRELGARLLLQIHDELVFECPDVPETVDKVTARIRVIMENVIKLRVPTRVSIGAGPSWATAKH